MLAPSSFFIVTAATEISTLSLHDALPICERRGTAAGVRPGAQRRRRAQARDPAAPAGPRIPGIRPGRRDHARSEEHTSELQSRVDLVCRLLLEKKKTHQRVRTSENELNPT